MARSRNALEELQSISIGQRQIQEDEVWSVAGNRRRCRFDRFRLGDLVARCLQEDTQGVANDLAVLDDQDVRRTTPAPVES